MIDRIKQWEFFKQVVEDHIINYTIPQYGNSKDDPIEEWDKQRCMQAIGKYVARSKTTRGDKIDEMRDLVKIAHFACFAFHKMFDEMGPAAKAIAMEKIRRGEQ